MPNYRRRFVPGGTYFFTLCLAQPGARLLTEHIAVLREAYLAAQISGRFRCDAMVVMPDHTHMVWTLPVGDAGYARRIAVMKAYFSRELRRAGFIPPADDGEGGVNPALQRRGEVGIWQKRFWEHTIRDADDKMRHMAYCWSDPVRHRLVAHASQWPHSSFERDCAAGVVQSDWQRMDFSGRYGEVA